MELRDGLTVTYRDVTLEFTFTTNYGPVCYFCSKNIKPISFRALNTCQFNITWLKSGNPFETRIYPERIRDDVKSCRRERGKYQSTKPNVVWLSPSGKKISKLYLLSKNNSIPHGFVKKISKSILKINSLRKKRI